MVRPQDRLEDLLGQHRQFLVKAQICIRKDLEASTNSHFSEFLSVLSRRLDMHLARLDKTEDYDHEAEGTLCWGAITSTRKPKPKKGKGSKIRLVVAGPGPEDAHTIDVGGNEAVQEIEAKILQYGRMSQALARAADQERVVAELRNAGRDDASSNQESIANDNDQDRIVLLKQYNDIRDVSQQLIGIIADNRSVPVRSLYADGSFGVGPDD